MRKIGDLYILTGLVWLVLGMAFGIWMGITQQFDFANSHAHFNLVGFATSVLFGLIYRGYPGMNQSRLAAVQFWLYEIGAVLLVGGKAMVDGGGTDLLVIVGSIVVIVGAILMAWIFALCHRLPA